MCCTYDAKMQLLDVPECLLQQHGAASPEGAVAMATGAAEKLGADYALAVSGFASPCAGSKENPVGTIFVAACTRRTGSGRRSCPIRAPARR